MTTYVTRIGASLVLALVLASAAPIAAEAAEPQMGLMVSNITMIPKPPTCDVRATKKTIRSGGSVDIVWKSKGAVRMTGLVKGDQEWPADGRQRVSIAVQGKHVFPLTFTDKNGTSATCVAKVFVHAKR